MERDSALQQVSNSSLFSSKSSEDNKVKYRKITAEEAHKRIKENQDVIVVDVRRLDEYNVKHIEGAILIPVDTISNKKPEQLPDLDAEILVYCRTGNRSKQASEKLIALGYTNVYDFGGIQDWRYETIVNMP